MNNAVDKRSYTRRKFLSSTIKTGAAIFSTGLLPQLSVKGIGNYNVLFMIIDDLRPMLGCYGVSEMHTPKIDSFSRRGTLFNRAYCQYPLCNPSRASILTGLRPATIGIDNNDLDYKQTVPNAVDMMQHFMKHGYTTHTIGKVKHYSGGWRGGPSWLSLNVSDDELSDGETARKTSGLLFEMKDQQFFLVVGFDKPHTPFYAPQKYYDLYDPNPFKLPLTRSYPTHSPSKAHSNLYPFQRAFTDIPTDGPISDEKTLELIRAYAACTSYMDAQVGRVLQQLDDLSLTHNTVVVICGDHGFHLGEHGTWRKNLLYEISVRSPLLMSVPGQQPCQTDALVELVDIFPTLCHVCDIPIPTELEGVSLMPVIDDPTQPIKNAAFSHLTRTGAKSDSIRTDRYRYTEWGSRALFGRELYDYQTDPHETINVVDLPENAELVDELSQRLRAGWKEEMSNLQAHIPIPKRLPWDVNSDGIVDIEDLLLVSKNFGQDTHIYPDVDVNKDGSVDIIDLLLVSVHLGESCYTSAPKSNFTITQRHIDSISERLIEAYQQDDGSGVFHDGIANLEALIDNRLPEQATLLPNYPNPFNPETWIPYDLARDSDVNISIYDIRGKIIRKIPIGFQKAGSYRTKEQAAYWDGYNSSGERVANGVYFYSLNTNHIKATRKMTIQK